jgi:hypothetical protein
MKVPAAVINRGKFVLGVLAVWAGVVLPMQIWKEYRQMMHWWEYRLEPHQLCWLEDGTGHSIPIAPILWWAKTRETHLFIPGWDKRDIHEPVTDDYETLVLVLRDGMPEDMETVEGSQLPIDGRQVDIQVITGPHSGRTGWIKRYRVKPVDLHAGK